MESCIVLNNEGLRNPCFLVNFQRTISILMKNYNTQGNDGVLIKLVSLLSNFERTFFHSYRKIFQKNNDGEP